MSHTIDPQAPNNLRPHESRRVRHALAARHLQVKRVRQLTPKMRRITLAGDELQSFTSLGADDHIKLFIPAPGQRRASLPSFGENGPVYDEQAQRSPMRDYTPRRHDAAAGELDIDFVLHAEGPATIWAARAAPGDWVGVAGPRGSMLVADDFDAYVLAGDEAALPAIARRLEELAAGTRALALIEVADANEEQSLDSIGNIDIRWLHRNGAKPGAPLEAALKSLKLPAGDCFVWVAAEFDCVRRIRTHLAASGHPENWIKATSYWQRSSR